MKTTRREFLRQMAITGAAISGLPAVARGAETCANEGKSRVVVATDAAVLHGEDKVVQDVLNEMLDESIVKLTGTPDAESGWKKLFRPDDVVALKVNCIAAGICTRPETVQAVVRGLKLAGVKPENIIIWDRKTSELLKCGFKVNKDGPGVRCYGVDGGWGKEFKHGVFKGRIARIMSEKATAIVNVPILKAHRRAGVSCCLKNHYGSIHNPSDHHDVGPGLADLNSTPMVKEKTRLVVIDGLRLQYEKGPSYRPNAQFNWHSLIVSQDPLAADCIALKEVEKRRADGGLPPLETSLTGWVKLAQDRGVGVSDEEKIELLKV